MIEVKILKEKIRNNIIKIIIIPILNILLLSLFNIGPKIITIMMVCSFLCLIIYVINIILHLLKIKELRKIEDIRKLFEDLHKQSQQYYYHIHKPVNQQKLENAYNLLKINKTDSIEKIKKTYKIYAIKWHPDKWYTSSKNNQDIASRNFKKLQSAYELIKKDKNII